MAKIIYDNETTFDALKDKTIAIMGYGSQGHAHARNLHAICQILYQKFGQKS